MERKWPEVKIPAEWEKKDIYKPVFLNKYGYYELRKQNTPEERGKNFEENYFQNYAGQTYACLLYTSVIRRFLNGETRRSNPPPLCTE